LTLNEAVAACATGNVCDFGCGAAKIAPFILHNEAVKSYTGIDFSLDMVNQARWHLKHFPDKPSEVIHGKIEFIDTGAYELEIVHGQSETIDLSYDFGVSVNSYYTWDAPQKILKCIYNALAPKAEFILVTPNPRLDMTQLLKKAERELVANPYFASFKEQNMALASNKKALFVEMDVIIEQAREAGFNIKEANTHFYDGGLNYLHFIK
jgi:SAM-dependent methyltransferase